jgi:heat shock protein HslJ
MPTLRVPAMALLRLSATVMLMTTMPGCSPNSSGPAPEGGPKLVGPTWMAEEIGGRGVLDSVRTTMLIDAAGQVTGLGGCNSYSGPARTADDTLRLGPIISTAKGCLPATEDQERRFFSVLASARRYDFTPEGKLVLYDERGSPIVTLRRFAD